MCSTLPMSGRIRTARPVLVLALTACLLAACGREEAESDPAEATVSTPVVAQSTREAAAQQQAADDAIAALSLDELREAALKAYQDSRLYAPAGDNAMEYYLALRDRQSGNAAASSALIDLLPMAVIATEQGRDRGDYAEARRLVGLIERADAEHPAVERLRQSIDEAEQQAVEREQQAQAEAEQARIREEQQQRERARQAELLRKQQEEEAAAAALAEEQAAAEAEAERARAEQEAARQQAAREAAARRRAEQLAAEEAAKPPPPPELKPLSTPPPRYPGAALRAQESGSVIVEFTVETDGSVSNPRVVRADPPRVFDREAIGAVRRWRFEPIPVPVTTRRTIGFRPSTE